MKTKVNFYPTVAENTQSMYRRLGRDASYDIGMENDGCSSSSPVQDNHDNTKKSNHHQEGKMTSSSNTNTKSRKSISAAKDDSNIMETRKKQHVRSVSSSPKHYQKRKREPILQYSHQEDDEKDSIAVKLKSSLKKKRAATITPILPIASSPSSSSSSTAVGGFVGGLTSRDADDPILFSSKKNYSIIRPTRQRSPPGRFSQEHEPKTDAVISNKKPNGKGTKRQVVISSSSHDASFHPLPYYDDDYQHRQIEEKEAQQDCSTDTSKSIPTSTDAAVDIVTTTGDVDLITSFSNFSIDALSLSLREKKPLEAKISSFPRNQEASLPKSSPSFHGNSASSVLISDTANTNPKNDDTNHKKLSPTNKEKRRITRASSANVLPPSPLIFNNTNVMDTQITKNTMKPENSTKKSATLLPPTPNRSLLRRSPRSSPLASSNTNTVMESSDSAKNVETLTETITDLASEQTSTKTQSNDDLSTVHLHDTILDKSDQIKSLVTVKEEPKEGDDQMKNNETSNIQKLSINNNFKKRKKADHGKNDNRLENKTSKIIKISNMATILNSTPSKSSNRSKSPRIETIKSRRSPRSPSIPPAPLVIASSSPASSSKKLGKKDRYSPFIITTKTSSPQKRPKSASSATSLVLRSRTSSTSSTNTSPKLKIVHTLPKETSPKSLKMIITENKDVAISNTMAKTISPKSANIDIKSLNTQISTKAATVNSKDKPPPPKNMITTTMRTASKRKSPRERRNLVSGKVEVDHQSHVQLDSSSDKVLSALDCQNTPNSSSTEEATKLSNPASPIVSSPRRSSRGSRSPDRVRAIRSERRRIDSYLCQPSPEIDNDPLQSLLPATISNHVTSKDEDHDLDTDLILIKSQLTLSQNSSSSALGLSSTDMSGIGNPLPVRMTRQSSIKSPKKEESQNQDDLNDDFCSTCFFKGDLLCCESCPKAFHPLCTDEAFNKGNIPEDAWECKSCRYAKTQQNEKHQEEELSQKGKMTAAVAASALTSITVNNSNNISKNKIVSANSKGRLSSKRSLRSNSNSSINIDEDQAPKTSLKLYDELSTLLDQQNPVLFKLPKYIRQLAQDGWIHPHTGAYIDKKSTLITPVYLRPKTTRTTQQRNYNPVRPDSTGHGDLNVGDGSSNSNLSLSSLAITEKCYQCNKSGYTIKPTSMILSSKFPELKKSSKNFHIQAHVSELIKCDYCDEYWHLDCLTPPLTSIPVELRADSVEYIDLQILDKKTIEHPHVIDNSPNKSTEKIFGYQIRKKWMCPLHADKLCEDETLDYQDLRRIRKSLSCSLVIENTPKTLALFSPVLKESELLNKFLATGNSQSSKGKPQKSTQSMESTTRPATTTASATYSITKKEQNDQYMDSNNTSAPKSVFLRNEKGEVVLNEEWVRSQLPIGLDDRYVCRLKSLYQSVHDQFPQGLDFVNRRSSLLDLSLASQIVDGAAHLNLNSLGEELDDGTEWLSFLSKFQLDIANHLLAQKYLSKNTDS